MWFLGGLRSALAWLGRQGTRALAASVFLGLAVPPLAAYVKPYLGETVFVLLLFSYLRTDPSAFGRHLKAPGLAIAGALWVMVAAPLLFGTAYMLSGVRDAMPALYTIMILQCAIAPMDGVPRNVMADPLFALELLALIIALTCVLIGISMLVFWRAGIDRGLVIGMLAAFRNLGVVMAAIGTTLPDLAWFYFAMVQFPIYLLPALLKPLAKRLQ